MEEIQARAGAKELPSEDLKFTNKPYWKVKITWSFVFKGREGKKTFSDNWTGHQRIH